MADFSNTNVITNDIISFSDRDIVTVTVNWKDIVTVTVTVYGIKKISLTIRYRYRYR